MAGMRVLKDSPCDPVEGSADQHHLGNELGSRGSGPTAEYARMSHRRSRGAAASDSAQWSDSERAFPEGQPQGEGTKGTMPHVWGRA